MDVVAVLRAADLLELDDVAALFRQGCIERGPSKDVGALRKLDARMGEARTDETASGVFSAVLAAWRVMGEQDRLDAVITTIEASLEQHGGYRRVTRASAKAILERCAIPLRVRFCYDASALPCLMHAARTARADMRALFGYTSTWAQFCGSQPVAKLIGYAALFLRAPLHIEGCLPWQSETRDPDADPFAPIALEVSMPEGHRGFDHDPTIIEAAKKTGLPRASVKGCIDVEALALKHAADVDHASIVFVSAQTCGSARQAARKARSGLLASPGFRQVWAVQGPLYKNEFGGTCIVEMGEAVEPTETVVMRHINKIDGFKDHIKEARAVRGQVQLVPVEEIARAGNDLRPSRYITREARRPASIRSALAGRWKPERVSLASEYDVLRATYARNDPIGTAEIHEVRPSDFSAHGVLQGPGRRLMVRDSRLSALEGQRIRKNDVLLVHRTGVGRVYLADEGPLVKNGIWIGQGITILRKRLLLSSDIPRPRLDHRLLYMFLLSSDVQETLREAAQANKGVVPIGDVERLAIPSVLLADSRIMGPGTEREEAPRRVRSNILTAFKMHRGNLAAIDQIEGIMSKRLTAVAKNLRF